MTIHVTKKGASTFSEARLLDIHIFNAPAGRVLTRRGGDIGRAGYTGEPGELIVMLKGLYRAIPEGAGSPGHLRAGPGDVVCWFPGAKRTEMSDEHSATKCFAIYFDWAHPDAGLPPVVRDHHGVIRLLAERLLQVHVSRLQIPWSVRDAYVGGILAEYRHLAAAAMEDSLVAVVTRYVEDHMAEQFHLGNLARHVGLDKRHFTRKFKRQARETPMQFVRRQKALRAEGVLLMHPRDSLARIARYIGVSGELQVRRLLRRYGALPLRNLRKLESAPLERRLRVQAG